jgi:protein phosphatase
MVRWAMRGPALPPGTAFDILVDVHGCLDEFGDLLGELGWSRPDRAGDAWRPPSGRHLVIAGDLVDRGPKIVDLLRAVMAMVAAGSVSVTVGNHDDKLLRALRGRSVRVTHGLEASLEQLGREPEPLREQVRDFLASLPSHLVLDGGRLVVAHAGLPEKLHGREGRRVRDFAMYGATAKGQDEHGLPIRLDWTATYRGAARVVYGHTPVIEPVWRHRTIDLDTGCVFGHRLTALRYPELDLVWVPARRVYQQKGGPFRVGGPGGPPADDVAIGATDHGSGEGEGDGPASAGVTPRGTRPAPPVTERV